jgi:hypothetical protein
MVETETMETPALMVTMVTEEITLTAAGLMMRWEPMVRREPREPMERTGKTGVMEKTVVL